MLNSLLQAYGQRIAELRKLKYPRDTAEDFAARVGCSRKTLYRVEIGAGGGKIDTYLSIAEVLGIQDQFADLFSPTETKADLDADKTLDTLVNAIAERRADTPGSLAGNDKHFLRVPPHG